MTAFHVIAGGGGDGGITTSTTMMTTTIGHEKFLTNTKKRDIRSLFGRSSSSSSSSLPSSLSLLSSSLSSESTVSIMEDIVDTNHSYTNDSQFTNGTSDNLTVTIDDNHDAAGGDDAIATSIDIPSRDPTNKRRRTKRYSKRKEWNVYYPKLVEYYNTYGHSNVTATFPTTNTNTNEDYYKNGHHNGHDKQQQQRQQDYQDLYEWTTGIRTRYRHQVVPSSKRKLSLSSPTISTKTQNKTSRRQYLSDKKLQQLRDVEFSFHIPSDHYHPDRMIVKTNNNGKKKEKYTKRRNLGRKNWVVPYRNLTKWNTIWRQKYDGLVEYYTIHGHCNPTRKENATLASFVQYQRTLYRRKYQDGGDNGVTTSSLTDDRIRLLELIGMEWTPSHDQRWDNRRQELHTFQRTYGTTCVPQDHPENPSLGTWVMNVRSHYKLKQDGLYSTMTDERKQDLDSIDFVWRYQERRANDTWWAMFEWAQDYLAVRGNLTVPTSDMANRRLRLWLNVQRHFYNLDNKKNNNDVNNITADLDELDETAQELEQEEIQSSQDVQINTLKRRLDQEKIDALESLEGFTWKIVKKKASVASWEKLFNAMRERGISPESKAKTHWFDGVNPLDQPVKTAYTEDELVALWYEGDEDEDDDWSL